MEILKQAWHTERRYEILSSATGLLQEHTARVKQAWLYEDVLSHLPCSSSAVYYFPRLIKEEASQPLLQLHWRIIPNASCTERLSWIPPALLSLATGSSQNILHIVILAPTGPVIEKQCRKSTLSFQQENATLRDASPVSGFGWKRFSSRANWLYIYRQLSPCTKLQSQSVFRQC